MSENASIQQLDVDDRVAAAVYKVKVDAACPLQPAVLRGALLQLLLWLWAVHGCDYLGGRELPAPPEISTAGPTIGSLFPVAAEEQEGGSTAPGAADHAEANQALGETCIAHFIGGALILYHFSLKLLQQG